MTDLKKKIREICTYHSDEGTSGYLLSEEQFEKLFALLELSRQEAVVAQKAELVEKHLNNHP